MSPKGGRRRWSVSFTSSSSCEAEPLPHSTSMTFYPSGGANEARDEPPETLSQHTFLKFFLRVTITAKQRQLNTTPESAQEHRGSHAEDKGFTEHLVCLSTITRAEHSCRPVEITRLSAFLESTEGLMAKVLLCIDGTLKCVSVCVYLHMYTKAAYVSE